MMLLATGCVLGAWWLPYLVKAEPARAERYRAMFGSTHAFLPERNGVRPNPLHVALHVCTAATLVVLALSSRCSPVFARLRARWRLDV
jgi:hypothetical protein